MMLSIHEHIPQQSKKNAESLAADLLSCGILMCNLPTNICMWYATGLHI